MPEFLPCRYICNVNFYNRTFNRSHGISYSNRSVGVTSGIQNYPGVTEARLVYPVDYLAFDIRLEVIDSKIRIEFPQYFKPFRERLGSVSAGFPLPEEIEVGSVDNQDIFFPLT